MRCIVALVLVVMVDFATIPLDRLIGSAQSIVTGDVVTVKDGTFTVRVSSTMAGDPPASEIEIRQYVPSRFEGAPRAAPYKPGQSFLWFLVRDEKQPKGPWRILGAGGEGEMPLEAGYVYFHASTVEGLPVASHRVHGGERKIQRFDAKVFCNAIREYRSCFEWKPGSDERTPPARRCDQAAIDRFARTSDIHRHIAQLTATRFKS